MYWGSFDLPFVALIARLTHRNLLRIVNTHKTNNSAGGASWLPLQFVFEDELTWLAKKYPQFSLRVRLEQDLRMHPKCVCKSAYGIKGEVLPL
jgi:hypothetical protein